MNIYSIEKHKWLLRILLSYVRRKFFKATEKEMEHDLANAGNPVFKHLYECMIKTLDHVKTKWQRDTIKTFGIFALWVAYKDTAYRDEFLYFIYHFLSKSEEMRKYLEEMDILDPNKWFINSFHKALQHTKEDRAKGRIIPEKQSLDATFFSQSFQREKLKEVIKNFDEQVKEEMRKLVK